MKCSEIYRFNTCDNCMYPVMKQAFEMTDTDVYNCIEIDFEVLKKRLEMKNISYAGLKTALVPDQDKARKEICFIFDTNRVDDAAYGNFIFGKFLPLLDKHSTYSILCGDYIDLINNDDVLFSILSDKIVNANTLNYKCSNQLFLVYINRLTKNQYTTIIEGLTKYEWFVGYVDVTYSSQFKSYISKVLDNLCIKNRNTIILSHPEDYKDEENVNFKGYSYEENGFEFVSINEESFSHFLSYKIETELIDENDIGFSFNTLFPKFDSYEKVLLKIQNNKWDKYLTDKDNGKGFILKKLGFKKEEKDHFIKEIYKKICNNYLYNLRRNEYGDLLFNVCVELQTEASNIRRTTIAIKYIPENGEMYIITIT